MAGFPGMSLPFGTIFMIGGFFVLLVMTAVTGGIGWNLDDKCHTFDDGDGYKHKRDVLIGSLFGAVAGIVLAGVALFFGWEELANPAVQMMASIVMHVLLLGAATFLAVAGGFAISLYSSCSAWNPGDTVPHAELYACIGMLGVGALICLGIVGHAALSVVHKMKGQPSSRRAAAGAAGSTSVFGMLESAMRNPAVMEAATMA